MRNYQICKRLICAAGAIVLGSLPSTIFLSGAPHARTLATTRTAMTRLEMRAAGPSYTLPGETVQTPVAKPPGN